MIKETLKNAVEYGRNNWKRITLAALTLAGSAYIGSSSVSAEEPIPLNPNVVDQNGQLKDGWQVYATSRIDCTDAKFYDFDEELGLWQSPVRMGPGDDVNNPMDDDESALTIYRLPDGSCVQVVYSTRSVDGLNSD